MLQLQLAWCYVRDNASSNYSDINNGFICNVRIILKHIIYQLKRSRLLFSKTINEDLQLHYVISNE